MAAPLAVIDPAQRYPDRLIGDAAFDALVTDVRGERARYYLRTLAHARTQRKACAVADISHTSVWRWRQDDPAFASAESHLLALAQEARRLAYEETLDDIALTDRNLLAIFFGMKKMDPSYRDNYKPEPSGHAARHTDGDVSPSIDAWRAMLDTLGLGDAADALPADAGPALLGEGATLPDGHD